MWWYIIAVIFILVIYLISKHESYMTYFSASTCKPVDTKAYDYTTRILAGDTWRCPYTYFDTGCNWTHQGRGRYQCRRTKGSPIALSRAIAYTKQVHKKKTSTSLIQSSSKPSRSAQWVRTNITYYGQNAADDNGKGFTGVDLFKLGRSGLRYNGTPVYPVAVHHDYAHDWLYAVVEVTGPKIASGFHGYVVDICNRADDSCANVRKNGLNFLIDIHKTGFEPSGNYNNGNDFTTGKVRRVGTIPLTSLPDHLFPQGSNTYVMCGCSAPCTRPGQRWKKLADLKKGTVKCT